MLRSSLVSLSFAVAVVAPSHARASASAPRIAQAIRAGAGVHIDGRLDDAAWQGAPAHGDFWQRAPHEGAPPGERTEFRVIYDDDAIYVALRAWDPEPHAIRARLHRRDLDSTADWLGVIIDSYHDKRTAFGFAVNAAGVQRDVLLYDDSAEDPGWDAVWSSAVAIDHDGWTAELRIPLGQLRFSGKPAQTWGLQVLRLVGRTGEQTLWSPSPRESQGFVSNFGELAGLDRVRPARRLELLPYVSGGLGRVPPDPDDPFHDAVDLQGSLGLDARLGLGSAFTLTATVNPDFGQVEADPSEVNLTANETFFAEKRPFFVEGVDNFQVSLGQGDDNPEALFYSRRIGAAPHGEADGAYVDAPVGTTIYGAAKLTGKTDSGWSVGVLEAVTAEERAEVDDGAGHRERPVVEPLTNYAMARVKKDLRGGKTTLGAALTSVARKLDGTDLADELHDQAVTGGVQVGHRFSDDTWNASLRLAGSWVHGAPAAIAATQTEFRHLYQRPDAGHVTFDPTRRSLRGGSLQWDLGKQGGKHWRYGVGGDVKSPGFEANDLGFHGPVDSIVTFAWLGYREEKPSERLNSWRVNHNLWAWGNFDGELGGFGGNVNGNLQLKNFWGGFAGAVVDVNRLDPGALRGGPALRVDPTIGGWGGFHSDGRKDVSGWVEVNGGRTAADDSYRLQVNTGLSTQLRSNVELAVDASATWRRNGTQYVDAPVDAMAETHYLFATIEQRLLGLTVRGSWTFTPDLSLQVYAQPFLALGRYRGYKLAGDTRAGAYADRFDEYAREQITQVDDTLGFDGDRDGVADFVLGVPDFNYRALRSTVVLRWQYRPGSSAYLIWSQGRESSTLDRELRLGRDLEGMLDAAGTHVVLVKLNYWFGA